MAAEQMDRVDWGDGLSGRPSARDSRDKISGAIELLLEQEDQGVAADVTQDLFMATVMQDSQLNEAVLAYFVGERDANPNSETHSSLIYACVKLRQLDDAFANFERMVGEGFLPDDRTYSHLIKGCGRTRQIRRGEEFFKLLKNRNAPNVHTPRVYNAIINMYSHQKGRVGFQLLSPSEAAPAWRTYDEMIASGVEPDQRTYNSLITLCGRTHKPDVMRALSTIREMDAVGIPISDITISALTQVLGRAGNLSLAKAQLDELIRRGVTLRTSTWRPLLHAAAVTGNVAETERMYEEMVTHTNSSVFDSFKHRVSNAFNYIILAHGYANGYEAAAEKLEQARSNRQCDLLSYSFMIELAQRLHTERQGRSLTISTRGRALCIDLWKQMLAEGIQPTAPVVHKMFSVWAQSGELGVAEEYFAEMKASSTRLRETGAELGRLWLGGDLDALRAGLKVPRAAAPPRPSPPPPLPLA